MKPRYELAQLITSHGKTFLKQHPQPLQNIRTLLAIRDCRTPALGGQKYRCSCCNKELFAWHSCRNRHCPKCQAVNREKWIWSRERELLPVPYFHVVFTLPDGLNHLAINHPAEVYNALFRAAWNTIEAFSTDHKHLGAKTGMTAVLHTWGQNLSLHPHLHCIIPAGGITNNGQWKQAKNKGKYLFPSQAMARVFRAKYVKELRSKGIKIPQLVAKRLFKVNWVVYAKQPFLGPKQVIEYLGRYTHKIAISNNRIKAIDKNGNVRFTWKDYRHGNQKKLMTLKGHEFLRRFCLHILPSGFVRIRHYGMLSSRNKSTLLNRARDCFEQEHWVKPDPDLWKTLVLQRLNFNPNSCPFCKEGVLEVVQTIQPVRGPPKKSSIQPNKAFYEN